MPIIDRPSSVVKILTDTPTKDGQNHLHKDPVSLSAPENSRDRLSTPMNDLELLFEVVEGLDCCQGNFPDHVLWDGFPEPPVHELVELVQ